MKIDRQKALMIGAAVAAVGWMVHLAYVDPWLDEMALLRKNGDQLQAQLGKDREVLARQDRIRAERDALDKLMEPGDEGSVSSRFDQRVRELCSLPSLEAFEVRTTPTQRNGDFVEHGVTALFRVPWRSFVTLLERLHEEKSLIKVERLTCTSRHEKDEQVAVDLTLTTIERAPAPAGGRK